MADGKKKMFEGFGVNTNVLDGFNVTESGLLVPKAVTPKAMADVIKEVAAQGPEAREAWEKKMDRRIGSMVSMYQSVFNTATNSWSGAADKPRHTVPNSLLRQAFRGSMIDQLLVLARLEQVKLVSRRVYAEKQEKGWLIKHKMHANPYFRPSEQDKKRMEEVAEALEHPWDEVHANFKDFLVRYVQDRLIIDRVTMPIMRSMTGKPLRFYLLPGDEIKPRYDILLRYMKQHNILDQNAAIQQIYSQQGVDMSNCAFVQELDSFQIAGAWKKDEIAVSIANPTNELNNYGWGRSCFERSIEATTLLLLTFQFNRQIFEKNYPDQLLVLKGEVDPVGLEYMKQQMWGTNGPQSNNRLPILPTNDPTFDMQVLKLRETLNEMQFTQLIRIAIALKAAAYRAHPSLINMAPDPGSDANKIVTAGQDQADIIGSMQEEGFKGLLQDIADYINQYLIQPWMPDLMFCWSVEDVPPEESRIAMWTQKVALGATADEWRASEGLPELEEVTGGKYSGKVPLSPFILQDRELDTQDAMMQQQMAMEEERGEEGGFTDESNTKKQANKQGKSKNSKNDSRKRKGSSKSTDSKKARSGSKQKPKGKIKKSIWQWWKR